MLPSEPVSWIQLDVLDYSCSINGSLAATDRGGESDAHRFAYEKHCWQSPGGVHVRQLEKKVSDGLDVAIVHVADVVFGCVNEKGFICSLRCFS